MLSITIFTGIGAVVGLIVFSIVRDIIRLILKAGDAIQWRIMQNGQYNPQKIFTNKWGETMMYDYSLIQGTPEYEEQFRKLIKFRKGTVIDY